MEKNKVITPIVIVLTIVFTILGATFAYWSWASDAANDTNVTFTIAADFSCGANGGGNITSANLAPASCTNTMYALQRTITTTITNNGSDPVRMDLWLDIKQIGSGLSSTSNFKWALTKDPNSCTNNLVKSGTFQGKTNNSTVTILSNAISADTYYLYIWLDAAETSTTSMNQSYSMTLGGSCTNEVLPTIEETMSKAALDNSTVNFAQTSEENNTNGIYLFEPTKNDPHPVYYYRGNVNNNALYADMCWKIVRTTSTGGTKLVYNGLPNGDTCNNTGTAAMLGYSAYNTSYAYAKHLGYMYDDTNSTIKTYIDNWYSTTLSSHTDELEDTIWCNDRSTASTSGGTINYGTYGRHNSSNGTHEPIVTCPNQEDAFTVSDTENGNGLLTYPVGLLTADEINMAGGLQGSSNTSYYLYNGVMFWTLSPSSWSSRDTDVWIVTSGGLLNFTVYRTSWVRPSVTLKPGMTISGGDGSGDRPYTFLD